MDDFSPLANFVIGGLSGMTSTIMSYPMDFIKIRMSVQGPDYYKSMFHCASKVARKEGIFIFYKGISASFLRQLTHASVRIGAYNTLIDLYIIKYEKQPSYLLNIGIALIAGISASFSGTPYEVIMNRIAIDGRLHKCERRNYKSTYHAFTRIVHEEGFLSLYRGGFLSIFRATAINLTQLSTYQASKEILLDIYDFNKRMELHFYSSAISGFFTSVVTTPIDLVKIRLQSMKTVKGKPEQGATEVFLKIIKQEGIRTFTKGFITDYLRMGPHTMILLMAMDQYTSTYKYLKQIHLNSK